MRWIHALGLAPFLGCVAAPGSESPAEPGTSTGEEVASASSDASTTAASTTGIVASSSSEGTTSSGSGSGSGSSSSTGVPDCVAASVDAVPRGESVTVDGLADPMEWDDSAQYAVTPSADWTVDVGIKHDGEALLIVFAGLVPPAPPPFGFPEVMIDVGNDKAMVLGRDDWWFHVSATDCHGVGEYDNYRTCVSEGDGWEANNYPGGSLIDLVEIRIDFSLLGIDPTAAEEIGLLLRLSDTQGYAAHWPEDAGPDDPSTWSTMTLCP